MSKSSRDAAMRADAVVKFDKPMSTKLIIHCPKEQLMRLGSEPRAGGHHR
jgi:hypothetical protein